MSIEDKLIPTQLSIFRLTQRIILKSQAGLEIALEGSTFLFKCIDTKKTKMTRKRFLTIRSRPLYLFILSSH